MLAQRGYRLGLLVAAALVAAGGVTAYLTLRRTPADNTRSAGTSDSDLGVGAAVLVPAS